MRHVVLFASMYLAAPAPQVLKQEPGSIYRVRVRNPQPTNVRVWLDCGPATMPVGPFTLLRRRTSTIAIAAPEGVPFGPCRVTRWRSERRK